ncbi:toxin-antitoxin system HicB family antitoxin [Lentilactobacillus raoultii]|uniref:Toxin-antitoxin system HicB family antitoxin n=1 Tax=Lentilactobacillus raoultii TaxID=1987503 RepID=A0ABW3PQM4_9LACO|nr:toxin-antitoxin system HicB family antitoxin [Lentilactobacillus raoultii]
MGDKGTEKRFLLRLSNQLYDQLAAEATEKDKSVNAYIVSLLEAAENQTNFEHRQFIGQAIPGKDIFIESGLVLVSGIYYRYLIDDNGRVDKHARYTVIEANGNILTLRKIKE